MSELNTTALKMSYDPLGTLWARADNATGDGEGVVSAGDLIEKAEEHWNVSGTSVIAAWVMTSLGGIAIFALYSWRRRRDPLIYIPRVAASKKRKLEWDEKYRGKTSEDVGICSPKIPPVDDGFLGWLAPQFVDFWHEFCYLLNRKGLLQRDEALLELVGLDALTYIHFLRLLRWLFLTITLFAAFPLILGNYYINTKSEYGSANDTNLKDQPLSANAMLSNAKDAAESIQGDQVAKSLLDNMQLFTAANIKGVGMAVHIGFEYAVTGFVILFVMFFSWHHDELVRKWVEKNQCEISFRSIMVTNLNIRSTYRIQQRGDKGGTVMDLLISEAKVEVCKKLGIKQRPFPDYDLKEPKGCSVVLTHKNMKKLSGQVNEYKEELWPEFEAVLTSYLRRNKQGVRFEYESLWKRILGKPTDVEKLLKSKGRELCVKKYAIENEQILARADPEMEDVTPVAQTITSAFITFPTAKEAQTTLKQIKKRLNRSALKDKAFTPDVQRAPRSKNIIWKNLDSYGVSKHGHSTTGKIFIGVVFFLNTVPLIFVTLLANLDMAIDQIAYLRDLRDNSEIWAGIFAVTAGIVPAGLAALFGYLLPHVVRWLNKWSGALTRGQLDKTVIRQLFIFQLVSNFVVFSCLGVIWETYLTIRNDIGVKSFSEIYDSLGDIPAKVTKAYISESSYWLSWYPIRAALVCVQLLQLPRIFTRIGLSITAKTGSDLHELAQPEYFEYAIEYIHVLFAMAVALIYTPLAPIVPVCSTIYFWALSIVHYNQVKFVEDTKETDGKCWHVARNRLLASTVLMQLLMTITIALKTKSPLMTFSAFIPTMIVLAFKQSEKGTSCFPNTADLIGLPPVNAIPLGDDIPEFEHELLRHDWMPKLRWLGEDRHELFLAMERFEWLNDLLSSSRVLNDKYNRKKKVGRSGRIKESVKKHWGSR